MEQGQPTQAWLPLLESKEELELAWTYLGLSSFLTGTRKCLAGSDILDTLLLLAPTLKMPILPRQLRSNNGELHPALERRG